VIEVRTLWIVVAVLLAVSIVAVSAIADEKRA